MAATQSDASTGSSRGMRYIDVHAHVFPDFYEDALKAAGINDVDGWTYPKWSPDAMFEAMDGHRIEAQILSLSSPGISFAEGDKASQLARRINEYMIGLVKEHPTRLGSMAVLPLPDVDASLAEIEYAFDTLGMDGVGILTNYNGVYLADEKIAPVLEELNRRKAVAFVHPTTPPGWKNFRVDIPAPVMEYTFDSTRMAQQLVTTGVKAKYPDIAIIVCHGGGTLSISHQRLVKYWMDGKNDIFDTFYYELTATTEHEQLAVLMAMTSPERCMMGFDFPFMKPEWFDPLQEKLESYDFTSEQLAGVIRNNALRLFPKVEQRIRHAQQGG